MEMEEDSQVQILLRTPFLAIVGAITDVKHGKFVFNVGEEKVEFETANLIIVIPLSTLVV